MIDDRSAATQFPAKFSAVTDSRLTVSECGLSASEATHSGPLIEAIKKVTHLIVLSPHLDDGVLSCGALMSYVRKEIPVTVVTFFTEGCSPPYTYSARRYLRKSECYTANSLFLARRTEDQEVLESVDISYVHVGLTEALFRRRKRPLLNWLPWASRLAPELCFIYPTYRLHVIRGRIPSDDADTVRHIIDAIDRIPSESSALFLAPLAIGSHKDHVLVRTAARESGKRVAYYSDFPYNTMDHIDPAFARQNSLVRATWSQDLVAKQPLIRGYRTQVDALFPGGEIPVVPEVYLLPEQQTLRLLLFSAGRFLPSSSCWLRHPHQAAAHSESTGRSDELGSRPSVSVVICAYTEDRWSLLKKSVASVDAQTSSPIEIIVCIDHNEELLRKSEEHFVMGRPAGAVPLIVVANKYEGRLGAARNTAVEFARGDVVAFLDDDAAAAADWLERLITLYGDERVGAAGGAPLPVYEVGRPRWFPHEFDWVFGCAYRGLPQSRAPLSHLIGANMSARRSALHEIDGFHSDNHDDMDMCHRIAFFHHKVLYEPLAIVHHFVPATRTTWHYFWRRCYFVNQGKVEAFAAMGEAAHLGAEFSFVARTLTTGVLAEMRQVIHGDLYGAARVGAMIVGITLAGLGHVSGKLRLRRSRQSLP